MGTTPTVVNDAAHEVNSIIKTAVDVGVVAAKSAAIAQFPFLGLPIVSTLFGDLLGYLGSLIYKELATLGTFTVIDIQTSSELNNYNQAKDDLLAGITKGDQNAINDAKARFKISLGKLIHWDGSASP